MKRIIFVCFWISLAGMLSAQLPLRNYVGMTKAEVMDSLDRAGYDYGVEDLGWSPYAEEAPAAAPPVPYEEPIEELGEIDLEEAPEAPMDEYGDEEQITLYSGPEFGYTGNDAWIFFLNDTCTQVQYNFYGDPYILASIREVMEQREDFASCFDLEDCWVQQFPLDPAGTYWNLFEEYEGDEDWSTLVIESNASFQENGWWYEFSKGNQ